MTPPEKPRKKIGFLLKERRATYSTKKKHKKNWYRNFCGSIGFWYLKIHLCDHLRKSASYLCCSYPQSIMWRSVSWFCFICTWFLLFKNVDFCIGSLYTLLFSSCASWLQFPLTCLLNLIRLTPLTFPKYTFHFKHLCC